MSQRTGKIARLPCAVREQVNQRLLGHQPAPRLLAWLNALPEVKGVLAEQFAGRPVNKQNLSQWRCGGFCEWQLRHEIITEARALLGLENPGSRHRTSVQVRSSLVKPVAGQTMDNPE